MITHIRLQNFKSWEYSGKVELAPLTGFFGTNSSGKSSLLQMLLLLKQTIEDSSSKDIINFGNETSLVNLGNFTEVIHGHQHHNQLGLEFGCQLKEPITVEVLGKKPDGQEGIVHVPFEEFSFITVLYKEGIDFRIKLFRYILSSCDIDEVKWESGFLSHTDLFGREHRQELSAMNCYGGPHQQQSHRLLRPLSLAFERAFGHVNYLGPMRVDPRRSYEWEGRHPQHIKQWGNQTIDALLSARVRKVTTLHEEEEIAIEQRISDWLQKMELAHSFSLDWKSGTDYEVRIQKSSSSPPVTLVDMGYGLSQFLPVLVHCFYAPVGSTLILEQPGIHLHPMVQSQLADLLIEVVNERKLQILVESHSEHLLTRLQRRIAEEKIRADQTALYFCENDTGTSKLTALELDELGNIKNWPKNFFGNEMGDLIAMTNAQSDRVKKDNC